MSLSNGVIMMWLCASTCFSGAAALKSFDEHKQSPCAICTDGAVLQPDVAYENKKKGTSYTCQEAQQRAEQLESLNAHKKRGPKNTDLTCEQARHRWASTCCKTVVIQTTDPAPNHWTEIGSENQCRCNEMNRTLGEKVESLEVCKQRCLDHSCFQMDYNDKGWCNTYTERCDRATHCSDGTGWKGFMNTGGNRATFSARNAGTHGRHSTTLEDTDTPHTIQVKLSNPGPKKLTFVKWGTPFEQEISYKILRSEPATSIYLGKVVRRQQGDPLFDSLVMLKPGEEIVNTIDINHLLAFHEAGDYKVFVDFPLMEVDNNGHVHQQTFLSADFNLHVEAFKGLAEIRQGFRIKGSGTEGCDHEQGLALVQAATNANEMLDVAIGQIDNKENPEKYSKWLGAGDGVCPLWDPQAKDSLQRVKDSILSGWVGNCAQCAIEMGSDSKTAYAYVYPADPMKTIHVCDAFFTAPDIVDHSPSGDIIYELLHFDDSMQDRAIGTGALKDLARQDACSAKHNPGNIAAYAEYVAGKSEYGN